MFYYVSKKNVDSLTENICPRCGAINYSGGSYLCCNALPNNSTQATTSASLDPPRKVGKNWSLENFRKAEIIVNSKS